MSLEGVEAALGLSLEKVQHLARLLMKSGPVTVITGRSLANLQHHRIWRTLATAMGWAGQPGGGWYPVEAGVPRFDVGAGGAASRPESGHPPTLAEVKERGGVKAVICSGNCLSEYLSPFGRLAEGADLIAHFGSFPNATWEQASMTFPAALWAEREGLSFSNDGAVQLGAKIVESPAECRTGLEFWMELARRFGWEAHFPWATEDGRGDQAAFNGWLLGQSPFTAKLQLDQLRSVQPGAQVFWHSGESAVPEARRACAGKFAPHGAPVALAADPQAAATADYPLALRTAQSSCRSGDASRFWPWTRSLAREDAVQINPETALLLGIENGDEVLIDTPLGALPARANLSRVVPRWLVASFNGVNGAPALVHKKDQLPDEARTLLKSLTP
jgi:anaerobic selenocysteine-containing dehydrogenase